MRRDCSVLSLCDDQALRSVSNCKGYKWIREFLYRECIVVVGEYWDGTKGILEIVPHSIH